MGSHTKIIVGKNDLAFTHEDYVRLWNHAVDRTKTPLTVTAGSKEVVYWNCPHGRNHTYEQEIKSRTNASLLYCKKCAELNLSQEGVASVLIPYIDDNKVMELLKRRIMSRDKQIIARNMLETHKEYARVWNAEKNAPLTLQMFTFSSTEEVYWNCPHGLPHTYKQDIKTRVRVPINFCRECAKLKLPQEGYEKKKPVHITPRKQRSIPRERILAYARPDLLRFWDDTNVIKPTEISVGSSRPGIRWVCAKCNKAYEATVENRVKRTTDLCNDCMGIKPPKIKREYSLKDKYPEYAELWNKELNDGVTSDDVSYGTSDTYYWNCPHGRNHPYKQAIVQRVHADLMYCKQCAELHLPQNSSIEDYETLILALARPDLMQYWAKENTINPYEKEIGSSEDALWVCPKCKKNYTCKIFNRCKRKTPLCNDCAGIVTKTGISLREKYPKYAELMNKELNGKNTPDNLPYGTHCSVIWNCPHGREHTYEQRVDSRIASQLMYCKKCAELGLPQENLERKKVDLEVYKKRKRPMLPKSRYLGYAYPELLPLWDKERNKGIDPYTVTIGSTDGYYWHCPHDELVKHSYKATPYVMTKDVALTLEKGHCNICRGFVVLEGYNDIASWAKRNGLDYLIEEWDNEKNGNIKITDRPFGSGKTANWVCRNCGYSWEASINNRTANRSGCPLCTASKLEQFGYGILTQWNVRFIKEKRFTEFYNISLFQFDYYLPDYKIIIEFDGLQHFKEDVTWKEIIPFNERVRRDKIKNTVLFKNGVPILRIPYIYDPTKKKYQDQIEAYIKTFIQTKKIPQHIIDFYASYNFSNYAELARKWNDTLS